MTVTWPASGAFHCLTALKTMSNHDPWPEDLAQEGRKGREELGSGFARRAQAFLSLTRDREAASKPLVLIQPGSSLSLGGCVVPLKYTVLV